jgi:23S rRNA pseudouridine1911/1915/1917 synthase
MRGERHSFVTEVQNGERLDRALSALFPEHSRSQLARLIADGFVRVDTEPATRASQRVTSGQSVIVEFPQPEPVDIASQNIPLAVLFQDADLVIIDKPAGLVVHPAAGHRDQTLVNALLFHITDLSGIGGEIRPGIVHRLDKDTSGVMVIAKSDEAHRRLAAAWNTEQVRKEYLAVVYGTPAVENGVIDAPIGRDPRDRKRMAIVPTARRAVTEWAIVEHLRHAALLRCLLRTGRTHQIRVHMKHLGHPLVGDPLYSGPQWRGIPDKKIQKALAAFGRQALHASRIAFPHPRTGERVTFEAAPPEDLRQLIDALRAT